MKFNASRLILTLILGLCAVTVFGQSNQKDPCGDFVKNGNFGGQSGSRRTANGLESGLGYEVTKSLGRIPEKVYPPGTKPLQIRSKPRAFYTDLAREKCVQGKVVLKVTFLSNGQIGKIKVVKGLPYGLSEQAVTVAQKMRFEPAMKRGKPVSVTKKVEYTFTIY